MATADSEIQKNLLAFDQRSLEKFLKTGEQRGSLGWNYQAYTVPGAQEARDKLRPTGRVLRSFPDQDGRGKPTGFSEEIILCEGKGYTVCVRRYDDRSPDRPLVMEKYISYPRKSFEMEYGK